jgi:tetratricopeptide (TPR) repeat protein
MEDPTLDAKAEKYKNMGNDEFKKQNYQAAINYYSEAIEIKDNEPAFFTNRAIAYLKIEKFEEARRDC